jgi:ferredoxin
MGQMSIKNIKIDEQLCIGCGSCSVLAPDAFELNTSKVKAEIKEGWEKVPQEDLHRACESCPVGAIALEED